MPNLNLTVTAEQRFLAFAAHELRGEVTLQRTLAEVTLAGAAGDAAALRAMGERVVVGCERQERLLEALLALARSDYGSLRREPVDLAATVAEVLRDHDRPGHWSTAALEPARIEGEPRLIERLVANLVDNAVRHNDPGVQLDVVTHAAAGHAGLTIENTGPVLAEADVSRLFEPFERRRAGGGRSGRGIGLGLTVVQAIARAHNATVAAHARVSGGLRIDVVFPSLD